VLDLSRMPPVLLRPGMVHAESLAAAMPGTELQIGRAPGAGEALRSPGLLLKHYSPRARLLVRSWENEERLKAQVGALNTPFNQTHIVAHTRVPMSDAWGRVSVIPHDPEAFARAIYAELHQCDEHGAALIVVEALPETAEWQGIRDRLGRASGI
jgi:L-threonylcarbamoyladenylate synthase